MTGSIRCRGTAISMVAMALVAFGCSDDGHAARPSSNGIALDGSFFQGIEAPRIGRAGLDRQGRLVMTGRAVPGQAVELVAGSRALGSAVTRADGAWRIVSPEPVVEGATTFLVRGRDGGTGRTLDGDAIRLTVPRGWSGRAVTLFTRPADVPRRVAGLHPAVPADARNSETERTSAPSNPLRSAVSADLVRATNESPVMFGSAGVRYAQALPSQSPAEKPADVPYRKSSDSPFDWFFRLSDNANHRFQDVVRRIAGGEAIPAPAGSGADRGRDAGVVQAPSTSTGVTLPVAGAPAPGRASTVQTADGSSPVLDWIERSAREYQGVIKRLSGARDETPTQGTTAAEKAATGLAIGAAGKAAIDKAAQDKLAAEKAAVEKAVADKVAADKAAAEKAAAEQKRLADAKAATDKAAAEKAAEEQKRLADAKAAADKAAADKAAAEKAAAEQKRLADAKAAADKAAAEKAAAEQKRLADAKAAADKAAAEKAAAEQKRLDDAKAAADKAAADKAAAEKAAAEQKRL
ncbi:MAG TPA: hypothetical protein PK970_13715, partial [Hyphomicrobiaceae bacterium]|nr:hypothetical protein [Hyphomicrobiaceae bacterium]